MSTCAILLAAGRGTRMGADKARLDLGGRTLLERCLDSCECAGVAAVVVRAADAAAIDCEVEVVTVPPRGEMLSSIRAGLDRVPADHHALVFPVDYAMVQAETVQLVADEIVAESVVVPLFADRPGHPIGLGRDLFGEVRAAQTSLREVVAADPARNRVVRVDDPWILRDLDTPDDLAAARDELG